MSRHVEIEERDLTPVMRRLDEIEALAEGGWGCFGQRVIDEEEFFVKMTRLRSVLPTCLQQSLDLLQARDQLLEDARTKADAIRQDARLEVDEVRNKAHREADRLAEAAQARREQLLQQAASRAKRLVEEAQPQAQSLLAGHPLVIRERQTAELVRVEAEQKAQEMRQAAEEDARGLEAETTRYTVEVLDKTSTVLDKLRQKVRQDKLQLGMVSVAADE